MGQKERGNKDPRVQATSMMWGIVVAITGCTIPLAGMLGSSGVIALPLLAMLSAGVGTGFIWGRKANDPVGFNAEQAEQIEMMRQTILDLHEHMDALERKVEEQALQSRINQAAGNIGGASASAASGAASGGKLEPPPIVTSRKGGDSAKGE